MDAYEVFSSFSTQLEEEKEEEEEGTAGWCL